MNLLDTQKQASVPQNFPINRKVGQVTGFDKVDKVSAVCEEQIKKNFYFRKDGKHDIEVDISWKFRGHKSKLGVL